MKQLVQCPTCESNGKKSILGEILDDGTFSVMRFHNGYTNIKSPLFAIVCGNCGGTAYLRSPRKEEGEGTTYYWESRVYRFQLQGTLQGTSA